MSKYVRPALMVLVLVGLVVAFGWLIVLGAGYVADGGPLRWFGVGLIVLSLLGVWSVTVLLVNGFQLQRISARAAAEGFELDTSGLARRPSGRIMPAAAEQQFQQVAAEYERNPNDWRTWYRLARAYDYAGDRQRGREFMKKALAGEASERKTTREQ